MLSTVPFSLNTRSRDTAWLASKAVGIQGPPRCCCQHGLQVVCQLLHRDDVASHVLVNINQPALLGHQVDAEQCMPRQPAMYASMLAKGAKKCCLVGTMHRQRHNTSKGTVSLAIEQRRYKR